MKAQIASTGTAWDFALESGRIRDTPAGPVMGDDYCSARSAKVDRAFLVEVLLKKAKKLELQKAELKTSKKKKRDLKSVKGLGRLAFLVEIQFPRAFQRAQYEFSKKK